ncbi:MAG: fimbria major subunit, partial [Muribaculaceae bacterium]|nr:fimbria major subunit [Muribaculaceae bacterium]
SSFGGVRGGLLLILALALFSCKDEAIVEPDNSNGIFGEESGFVLSFKYDLPSDIVTRSSTTDGGASSDGYEDATAPEKALNAVIIITGEAGQPLLTLTDLTSDGFTLKKSLKPSDLADLFGHVVDLYVVSGIGSSGDTSTSGSFGVGTFTDDDPLGAYMPGDAKEPHILPIANKEEFKVDLTKKGSPTDQTDSGILKFLEDNYSGSGYTVVNGSERILDLSAVKENFGTFKEDESANPKVELERCVARVDFKPSRIKDAELSTSSNTVYLGDNILPVGVVKNLYAKMTSLQLINVSRSAYVFRHTSIGNNTKGYLNDDLNGNPFGIENANSNYGQTSSGNVTDFGYTWMADDDWDLKENTYLKESKEKENWEGPFAPNGASNYADDTKNYFMNQPTKGTGESFFYVHPYKGEENSNNVYGYRDVYTFNKKETNGDFKMHPWCYMTENTLPSTDAMIRGLSTGVAFNMMLTDKEGNPLTLENFKSESAYNSEKDELQNELKNLEEQLEALEGVKDTELESQIEQKQQEIEDLEKFVVGSLEQQGSSKIYKLTIGNQECYAELREDIKVAKTTSSEGDAFTRDGEDNEGEEEEKEVVPEHDIVEGFVVTYYYFFRHNIEKDYKLGYTGPMQFGVVRNNIYKLSVTALNDLPMPYDPSDPDEPQNAYMSVELKVLAWAKRDISVSW